MIRYLILFLLLCTSTVFSQDTIPRYWIGFTDKINSNYTLNNPLGYLSERAILRREKQAILIDSLDLPVSQLYIQSVLAAGDFELWAISKWLNGVIIKTQDTLALDSIVNFTFVESLDKLKSNLKPLADNKFDQELSSKSTLISIENTSYFPFGLTYMQHHLHGSDVVQNLGFNGQGKHIAILDAGFKNVDQTPALEHLINENRILSTYDFVRKENSVYEDHYHGEAVLSIIAGYDPEYYVGSATKASFHLLISEDVFSETITEEYYWVVAAEYADSAGVDIINTSLGYTTFDDSTTNHTYADMNGHTTIAAKGLNVASSKGILCVTSAGNSGANSWKYISTPADADLGLTVGAVDSNGIRAPFSSQGPSFDGDIKPNVMSVGWNTYYIPPGSSFADQGNGTSFSAPMMTGMVAALWEAMPELTNLELIDLIEEYSHLYEQPDSLMGYGIPNIYQLLLDNSNHQELFNSTTTILNVYPNPFNEELIVLYKSDSDKEIEIKMHSISGQIFYNNKFNVKMGVNKLRIFQANELALGIYLLSVDNEVIKAVKSK